MRHHRTPEAVVHSCERAEMLATAYRAHGFYSDCIPRHARHGTLPQFGRYRPGERDRALDASIGRSLDWLRGA